LIKKIYNNKYEICFGNDTRYLYFANSTKLTRGHSSGAGEGEFGVGGGSGGD
jgi:hypothetical protein